MISLVRIANPFVYKVPEACIAQAMTHSFNGLALCIQADISRSSWKQSASVWALDRFAEFGNNVSNTQVLDQAALR